METIQRPERLHPARKGALTGIRYLDRCRVDGDEIMLGEPEQEILRRVQAGEIYVAKCLFSPEEMRAMYMEVFTGMAAVPPRVSPFAWGMENFWRIDNNPPASAIPKIQAIYFICLWNDAFPGVRRVGAMLGRLRNRMAGLPDAYGFRRGDDYCAIPTLQHYPKGGGHIARHEDPAEPQQCVVSLTLSAYGSDYHEGGFYLERGGEAVPVDEVLEPGDISIVRPDVQHGVWPVDPGTVPVNFHAPEGRWRMSTILTTL